MTSFDLGKVRLLAISDAAPARNGAGSYYYDLQELLEPLLERFLLVSPTIDESGKWQAGYAFPLPGDKTQKLCFPGVGELKRLFAEFKPHVVVVATPGVYGITGARLARRSGIPYLTGMHTSFEQLTELYWPDSIRGKLVRKVFDWSNAYLFRHTHAVLVNSDPIAAQAQAMGASRIRLISTPVATEFMHPPPDALSGKLEQCLFAGRLAPEKNLDAVFAAATKFPDVQFTIAGDGPLRSHVEKASEENANIHYVGWLNRRQLREAVDRSDALLLPSHFETFGTVALEAMARGKLVLVSEHCGLAHWPSLREGLIVHDQGGLVASLGRVLEKSEGSRRDAGYTARQAAVQWNAEVAKGWEGTLSEAMGEGGSAATIRKTG